jgi:hypothetical protein
MKDEPGDRRRTSELDQIELLKTTELAAAMRAPQTDGEPAGGARHARANCRAAPS